ncbi:MAG: M56 family metallopeptidase [Oscillospiraceae bacterium]
MDIIGMSISGAVMILLIILLRRIFRKSLPKRAVKLMWLAAAVRLLVPVDGLLSVSTSVTYDMGDTVVTKTVFDSDAMPYNRLGIVINADIPDFARYLWLFGAVFIGAYFLFCHGVTRRKFSCALPCGYDIEPLKRSCKIKRRVALMVSDMTDTPFTYGIIFPKIILPKTLDQNDEKQLKNILFHELSHIKSFDVLYKLVMLCCVSVHWFDPLVWVMLILSDRDTELACDERAIAYGNAAPEEYAMALISMEERRCSYCAAGFAGGSLEERIVGIMTRKKRRHSVVSAVISAALTIAAAACVNVVTMPPYDSAAYELTVYYDTADDNTTVTVSDDAEAFANVSVYSYPTEEISDTVWLAVTDEGSTSWGMAVSG